MRSQKVNDNLELIEDERDKESGDDELDLGFLEEE